MPKASWLCVLWRRVLGLQKLCLCASAAFAGGRPWALAYVAALCASCCLCGPPACACRCLCSPEASCLCFLPRRLFCDLKLCLRASAAFVGGRTWALSYVAAL